MNIRQQKISRQIQKDFAVVLDKYVREQVSRNVLVTIIDVYVTPDLSLAKLYLGFLGTDKKQEMLETIKNGDQFLRKMFAQGPGKSMKKLPVFNFFLDQSLDKADRINALLEDL